MRPASDDLMARCEKLARRIAFGYPVFRVEALR